MKRTTIEMTPFEAYVDAVERGDVDAVRVLLDAGESIHRVIAGAKVTALIVAAKRNHVDLVRLLLERGANKSAFISTSDLLTLADSNTTEDAELVKLLTDHDDRQTRSYDMKTCAWKQREVHRVDECATALILASFHGHEDVVRLLLEAGADANQSSEIDYSALDAASRMGHLEIVKMLLDAGAFVNVDAVIKVNNTHSPLLLAVHGGHYEVARILIDAGASENHIIFASSGYIKTDHTALIEAVDIGHVELVRLLLPNAIYRAEKDFPPESGDDLRLAALNVAVENENEEIVRILVEESRVCDIDDDDYMYYRDTPLILAARRDNETILRTLLGAVDDGRFGVDVCNDHGHSPLFEAASHGRLNNVKLLVEAGASLNLGNTSGETALGKATKNGHLDVVEYLARVGASMEPDEEDEDDD